MAESRYLLRIAPVETCSPIDIPLVMAEIHRRLYDLHVRAAHLRISTVALEFDLYSDSSLGLESALQALVPFGRLLTRRSLSELPATIPLLEAVNEARRLFNEQRFWEVHEALEDHWKMATGDEKTGLQGLILIAAALVHGQRNEPTVMGDMLKDARPRLDALPETYLGWSITNLKHQADQWIRGLKTPFPTTKDIVY